MEQFGKVSLFDMVLSLSDAIDLVSPIVNGHHKRVAYIASSIALELGLAEKKQRNLIIAGALHDVGAFSLQERINALNFDLGPAAFKHAEIGYNLIGSFGPFKEVAEMIRYHHLDWAGGAGESFEGDPVLIESHILHLADRIDVLIENKVEILEQSERIITKINEEAGAKFIPQLVEVINGLAVKESFWFDIDSPLLTRILAERVKGDGDRLRLNFDDLYDLTKMFRQIIDFRSQFTATHSRGVANSGRILGELLEFSKQKCQMLEIAGYLHDLGKLAVPVEILNKPGKLTKKEFYQIKKHPFYTYRVLERIDGLKEINRWAAFHHEKLDGRGYPFRHQGQQIPLGAKIIAVSDVFTAITEDRPYRQGMDKAQVIDILEDLVEDSALDLDIVTTLIENYNLINTARQKVQAQETKEYNQIWKQIN
ncbi:HD domain-containing protein [Natroniella acetigena]|uniref:HD-GYP domain-containing protein n=1 Tax=Natroniella acetigena TaxID=52004 RepID=UPI00200B0FAF|nr:HD domain-containing phosphohydrolase [Natroniella acetigena]MCK8827976.1 HD domain-containing protein [Natroniella acetigena]